MPIASDLNNVGEGGRRLCDAEDVADQAHDEKRAPEDFGVQVLFGLTVWEGGGGGFVVWR